MGAFKIRNKDIARQNDDKYLDKVPNQIKGADTPDEIISQCKKEAKRLGLRIVHKSSTFPRLSKFTTTLYKEIRLGTSFRDKPRWVQATIWAHEMVHVYQWRGEKRARFALRYIGFPGRYRWAYEMQAYRMSIHVRKVLKATRSSTNRSIEARPKGMKKGYSLGLLRWRDLRGDTRDVLYDELERKRAA